MVPPLTTIGSGNRDVHGSGGSGFRSFAWPPVWLLDRGAGQPSSSTLCRFHPTSQPKSWSIEATAHTCAISIAFALS